MGRAVLAAPPHLWTNLRLPQFGREGKPREAAAAAAPPVQTTPPPRRPRTGRHRARLRSSVAASQGCVTWAGTHPNWLRSHRHRHRRRLDCRRALPRMPRAGKVQATAVDRCRALPYSTATDRCFGCGGQARCLVFLGSSCTAHMCTGWYRERHRRDSYVLARCRRTRPLATCGGRAEGRRRGPRHHVCPTRRRSTAGRARWTAGCVAGGGIGQGA